MVTSTFVQTSDLSRVWITRFSAGPSNRPDYEGLARADVPTLPLGDITPIFVPDSDRYGKFVVAGKVRGDRGLPTLGIMWRNALDKVSVLDRIVNLGCEHDIQIHMGECQDPQDFNFGWERVLVLERVLPTQWTTSQLGALQASDRAVVDEEVAFSGEEIYHIYRIQFAEEAVTQVVQEVIKAVICDEITCGNCGLPSTGCDVALFLTLSNAGSPGLPAEVIFTQDGGTIYGDTLIDTLAAAEDPNDMACIGINLVVISEDSESIHYAPLADVLAGTEVWIEITTGFVVTNGPLAMHSQSPRHTWIVGENGYVYFTTDPTAGVTVQDAGVATIQDLNAVHAFDTLNIVAVGASNAVIVSRNGGDTWAPLVGPNPGVILNTVWLRGINEWLVGDAGGQLWYTVDGGVSWTEKLFPGSGAGVVRDIRFANGTVGYMAHDTAAIAGLILRTIDGGFSWYIAPEGNTSIPANDRINSVAPCLANPNILFAGGLADDALDGIIVKGA